MKEIFDFINSILNSISWPITSIIIILLLRIPLTNILNRLGKVKYKDLEVDFSKEIEEVKEHLDSKLEVIPLNINFQNTLLNEVTQIAEVSPMAAIPFAYTYIENALREKVKEFSDYNEKNIYLINNIAKYLLNNEKIDSKTFEIINKMRKIRNEVSHNNINNTSIKKLDAIEYGKNAEIIIEIIKAIN